MAFDHPLFQRVQLLPRVLDHRDRRDFDVGKDLTLFFDAPDIDVLHDVAPKSENGGSMP
jgi:hypothetical protein